jgi:hypothetical protein
MRNLRNGADMAAKPDELLPTAKEIMQKLALAEAEEASKGGGGGREKGIARSTYEIIGTFR